jgi:CRISPR-associated endonuclease/helicase Cas3
VRNGEILPYNNTPSEEQAKVIAGCSVRLPLALSYNDIIANKTIKDIESAMSIFNLENFWYQSYWLRGALVLVLDEEQSAILGDYYLRYNQQTGLSYTKGVDI